VAKEPPDDRQPERNGGGFIILGYNGESWCVPVYAPDFSNVERGKFYRPDLRLIPPVRLKPEVLDFLATRAKERGTTVNQLVNQLLKKDMELIQAAAG